MYLIKFFILYIKWYKIIIILQKKIINKNNYPYKNNKKNIEEREREREREICNYNKYNKNPALELIIIQNNLCKA